MDLDRGNKLWVGHRVILPEHEECLWQERKKLEEYQPPELDDDALYEISRIIERSYLDELPIVITYATKYQAKKYCGFVMKIDAYEKWIKIQNGDDYKLIPFRQIIGAKEPPMDD